MNRITWNDKFLSQAFITAQRSHDTRTQCGAILVNKEHEIVAEGFNGHIRGVEDGVLPNHKEDKYPFMIHAEMNALLSCAKRGVSAKDTFCYVTTVPCITCYQAMWQAGISKIYIPSNHIKPKMCDNNEHAKNFDLLKSVMKNKELPIITIEYDSSILIQIGNKYVDR